MRYCIAAATLADPCRVMLERTTPQYKSDVDADLTATSRDNEEKFRARIRKLQFPICGWPGSSALQLIWKSINFASPEGTSSFDFLNVGSGPQTQAARLCHKMTRLHTRRPMSDEKIVGLCLEMRERMDWYLRVLKRSIAITRFAAQNRIVRVYQCYRECPARICIAKT